MACCNGRCCFRKGTYVLISLYTLASGSGGNSLLLSAGGVHLLVDAGISARRIKQSLAQLGLTPDDLSAILITHEHTDHTAGLATLLKHHAIPLYASGGTAFYLRSRLPGLDGCLRPVSPGSVFSIGPAAITVFATSHDAAASFGFRVESPDGDALGYITDSGIVTSAAHAALRDVRILALESNHDERMLQSGDYPYVIKRRIASEFGHLSNPQAAEELAALITESRAAGLRMPEAVVAMHISQNTNDYDLPRAALEKGLAIAEGNARVLCGYQGRLTSVK